jgi:hypothetical protein
MLSLVSAYVLFKGWFIFIFLIFNGKFEQPCIKLNSYNNIMKELPLYKMLSLVSTYVPFKGWFILIFLIFNGKFEHPCIKLNSYNNIMKELPLYRIWHQKTPGSHYWRPDHIHKKARKIGWSQFWLELVY